MPIVLWVCLAGRYDRADTATRRAARRSPPPPATMAEMSRRVEAIEQDFNDLMPCMNLEQRTLWNDLVVRAAIRVLGRTSWLTCARDIYTRRCGCSCGDTDDANATRQVCHPPLDSDSLFNRLSRRDHEEPEPQPSTALVSLSSPLPYGRRADTTQRRSELTVPSTAAAPASLAAVGSYDHCIRAVVHPGCDDPVFRCE